MSWKTTLSLVLSQLLSASLFCCFFFLAQGDETPIRKVEVRVGAYDNYPKVYQDESGRIKGLFPEILEAVAAKTGWKITYVFGDWMGRLDQLEKGEIDMMVDVAFSVKRAERFAFNEESILVNWGAVYTRKADPVESFPDLAGKKIAVMKGSIHTDGENGIRNLLRQFNVTAELVEVENYTRVFELLERAQVDAGVVNRVFGALFAKDYDLLRSHIIFNPSQLRFAFSKRSPLKNELIENIDRSIKRLKNQPDSIYYRAIDAYLSGQPSETLHHAEKTKEEPTIRLTMKEKAWIQDHRQIRAGADPEFIPFEYFSENNIYSGVASDYVKILNQRLGINLSVSHDLSWKEVIEMAKRREIDVLPCVGKTLERLSFLRYSRPYIEFERVIITRSNAPFITGLKDISHQKVAVQSSSSHYGFLVENTDIIPVGFMTLQEALMAVSKGRADAFVGNLASSTYWIRSLNLTNLRVAAKVQPEFLSLYFAVRNDWPELVGLINKGLQSISQEEKDRIFNKWVSVEYRKGVDPKVIRAYVLRIGAIVIPALAAVLGWILLLKREITRRKTVEAQLQYSGQLERLVSETSSRFISLKTDEIDNHIETILGLVADFIGVDLAGMFKFSEEENRISCTRHWIREGYPDALIDRFETDVARLPWWRRQMTLYEVLKVSSLTDLPGEAENLKAFIGDTGVQSFLDISQTYQDRWIGFLRFGSIKASRFWKNEEIALLKLIGQIITNATQRAKAERGLREHTEELRAANIRLKELDQLKSMFIASMSHELRTPLNSIIGFTGIILKGMTGEINEKQSDQLRRVYQSAKHLLNLITDVIDISKIEAGRMDVYLESFQLSEVVNAAVDTTRSQASAKGLEIEIQTYADLEMFQDKRRFLQCVINYLSNAVKYTEKGVITISMKLVDEKIEIAVKDTGIGIDKQDLSKLFEPFERLDSHLRIKAGGTGLGLYLTRKIVREMLQGDIFIESEIGVGSVFGLRIPFRRQIDSEIQSIKAS